MITVIAALKSELLPILSAFNITEKHPLDSGTLYQGRNLHLLRTGVGGVCARVFESYLQDYRPRLVINLGLAGALNPAIRPGQIFRINRVHCLTPTRSIPLNPLPAAKSFTKADVLTVKQAVTQTGERDWLHALSSAELVDMEACYLAERCAAAGISFAAFKIVSDLADERTQKDFMARYKIYSLQLADRLLPILEREWGE